MELRELEELLKMKWSTTQNTAIFQRDKNILVSAAAGSGKTAVLVERIKQLIINDGVSIDRMLIVTFTKSAASEMKDRIQQAILKELEHENPEFKETDMAIFLRQQLYRVEDANISTFHSFCTKIIRRYFYVIEIDPNLKVCDEYQKAIVWEEAMNELIDEKFQSEDESFVNFLKAYANKKDETQLKDILRDLYHEMMSMPEPFKWLQEKTAQLNRQHETHQAYMETLKQNLKNELLDQLSRMIEIEKQIIAYSMELGLEKYVANEEVNLQALMELKLVCEGDLEKGFLALNQFSLNRSTAIKGDTVAPEEKSRLDHLKLRRGQVLKKELQEKYSGSTIEEAFSLLEKTYPQVKVLEGLLLDFHALYGNKKRDRGWMDFNDLEHFALAILENEKVAEEYKQYFEHIFIDEYQDSNLIQEALIEKISRSNNLFMVGDVKQSIYRFRLADPTIFIKKYETYAEAKEESETLKLDLNRNYRSKKNIIEVTNHVFSNIMSEKNGEMRYTDEHALYKGVSYPSLYDYPVEMNVIDYDVKVTVEEGVETFDQIDEAISEMKKAEVEGAIIGNLIKENYGIDLYDCKLACVRKAKYKDIVIIFRTKKNWMSIIYEKLNEANIPAYMEDGDTYFEAIEVTLFLDLLSVIDNRQQDIPLLALMRGPVFNFTTDELLEIRVIDKKVSYYEAFQTYMEVGKNEGLKIKMRQLVNRLDQWKEKSSYMKLEELIDYLYEDSGILNYVMALPKGREREGNFRLLLDKAFSFNQMTTKSLFNFIKYMEQLKESDAKISPRKIPGEEEDVVRLMTIHGSKGLEFPIVILGGLGKKFNTKANRSKVSLHKALGIGLGYVDYKGHVKTKTVLQKLIEGRKQRESRSEDMRVLYVALTRAVDKLILVGTLDKGKERLEGYKSFNKLDVESGRSFMDWLAPLVVDNPHVTFCEKSATEELMKSHLEMPMHGSKPYELQEAIKEGISKGSEIKLFPKTSDYELIKGHIDTYLNWKYEQTESTKTPSKYTVSELNQLVVNEAATYSARDAYGTERSNEIQIPIKSMDKELYKMENDRAFSNAEKGTILHKVMYFLNEKKGHEKNYIENKLNQLVEKGCLTPLERKVIDEKSIQTFYLSALGQRLASALSVEKEKSFNLLMDAHHKFKPVDIKGEILVQGTIDCFFKETEGVVVVDYKTDFIVNKKNPEQEIKGIVDRYKSQLELYKEAIESIQGETVKEMYLYLFNIHQAIKL